MDWTDCLEPLEEKKTQRQWVGFDVETYGETNEFYLGGIYYYRGRTEEEPVYEAYYDKEEYQKALLSFTCDQKTVIAHNLSFDMTTTFYESDWWNDINILYRGSDMLTGTYENNGNRVTFLDTMNYFPTSLRSLGQMIDVPKLEKPEWLGQKPKNETERKRLERYNKRDCKICVDFMRFFEKGIWKLGGTVKITSASTSFDVFRRGFLDQTIWKNDSDYHEKIFKSYHGGRTEAFERGYFEDVEYYDINSLYPSVMRKEFPDPTSAKYVRDGVPYSIIEKYEGVSKVTLFMGKDNPNKPFIPIYEQIGDMEYEKLLFRKGTITKWVTHPEIRKAKELEYEIYDIHETIYYTETIQPFESFVNELYDMRQQFKDEENPYEAVVKLVMNSLYGKFGQKSVQKTDIVFHSDDMTYEEEQNLYDESDVYDEEKEVFYVSEEESYKGTCQVPIWVSYITAYARMVMYPYINRDDCIYTDTDSVILKGSLDEDSDELGEMDHEASYSKCMIVRAKFYGVYDEKDDEWGIKIKGVPSADHNDFLKVLNGESVTKQSLVKLRQSIRTDGSVNQVTEMEKTLNLDDDKRVWEKDRFTIYPQESQPYFKVDRNE